MKIAIVGLGTISGLHLDIIRNSKHTLVAVCDKEESKLKEFDVKTYTEYEKMLENEDIDVIHITTPHFLHKDMILKANEKGINVLCEKPLTLNSEDAKFLLDNVDEEKAKVCVCLQNRLNTTTLKMKEIVEEEKYGKLVGVCANVYWQRTEEYYSNSDWRGFYKTEGGGVLINQAIHTIDLVDYLVSSSPLNVLGNYDTFRLKNVIEVEDNANFIVDYENGVSANLNLTNTFTTNLPVEIKLVCEDAVIQLIENKLLVFKDEEVEVVLTEEKSNKYKSYFGPSHSKIINQFYQAIENNNDNYVNFKDGISVINLIDMLRKGE